MDAELYFNEDTPGADKSSVNQLQPSSSEMKTHRSTNASSSQQMTSDVKTPSVQDVAQPSLPPIKVNQLQLHDRQVVEEDQYDDANVTTEQKNTLKRYFSTMIDDYPDYFMNMVSKREKVKRLR